MTTPAALSSIDTRLLTTFMAVVESGGFAPAQVSLNISASAISRSISDLEARLGLRLCQRGRIGFRLTEKGERVYEACKRLAGSIEQFQADVGTLRGQLIGELSLAIVDNWIADENAPVAGAIDRLKAKGPEVRLSLMSLAPGDIETMVLDDRARIGVGVFRKHRPGLSYRKLCDDPMELYCGDRHPRFRELSRANSENDIAGTDYARRGYLSEEQVAPKTATLPSTATGYQMESIAFLILSGRYIGYLPVTYAQSWVDAGRMASILPSRFGAKTAIEIVTKKGLALTLVERTFIDFLLAR